MSNAMEWSQNFCLACDNVNNTAAPYCSETCRLSDMDRSSASDSHFYSQSYSSTSSASSSAAWGHASSKRNSIISIQPGSYSARSPAMPSGSYPSSPSTASFFASAHEPSRSSAGRYHQHSSSHWHSQSKRSLASHSSRSSLASAHAGSYGLSDQAVAQLRYYVSSFDQSRDNKRRGTLS